MRLKPDIMKAEKIFYPVDEVENMRTVYEMLQFSVHKYPTRFAYRQIEDNGEESSITFLALSEMVNSLRASLIRRGYSGRHIAILGETSIQWIESYLALISGVGICVPIDKELGEDTMCTQLNKSDVDCVFVSHRYLGKLLQILPSCGGINEIILMSGENETVDYVGLKSLTLDSLIHEGTELLADGFGEELLPEIDPNEASLIIFTSGTTGANKGVMLSNGNILGTLRGAARLLRFPSVSFSVLPVNHAYEINSHLMSSLYCGTCVCINNEPRYFLKNMKHFRPEMTCMVPAMLDALVRQLKKEIDRSGKRKTFDRVLLVSGFLRKIGIDLRRFFFKELLNHLGGNLRMIICGGAFLDQNIVDFLSSIGIDVYNGYGITECSPIVAVNSINLTKGGSVGRVLPTAKVRIADPDDSGNGEIQVRGDMVMLGYYGSEEDTARVFTADGWLRTGDLGHLDRDHFLYITGRLKNLIILPNGKNIYPEEIEEALMKKAPCIRECVVLENDSHSGLYGLIYPDSDFCSSHKLSSSEEIKAYIKKEIDKFNLSEPTYKRLSDFELRETEFEKNTTHKILRFKVLQ